MDVLASQNCEGGYMIFEIGTFICLLAIFAALVLNAMMWKHQIEANKIILAGFKFIEGYFKGLEKQNEQK